MTRYERHSVLARFEELRVKLPWPLSDRVRQRDYFQHSCLCGACPFLSHDKRRAELLMGPNGETLLKAWAHQQQEKTDAQNGENR